MAAGRFTEAVYIELGAAPRPRMYRNEEEKKWLDKIAARGLQHYHGGAPSCRAVVEVEMEGVDKVINAS